MIQNNLLIMTWNRVTIFSIPNSKILKVDIIDSQSSSHNFNNW